MWHRGILFVMKHAITLERSTSVLEHASCCFVAPPPPPNDHIALLVISAAGFTLSWQLPAGAQGCHGIPAAAPFGTRGGNAAVGLVSAIFDFACNIILVACGVLDVFMLFVNVVLLCYFMFDVGLLLVAGCWLLVAGSGYWLLVMHMWGVSSPWGGGYYQSRGCALDFMGGLGFYTLTLQLHEVHMLLLRSQNE